MKKKTSDKEEKDRALCGVKDTAEDCEKLAAELGTATRDLLRQRVRQERQLQALSERASVCREKADAKAIVLKEKSDIVASMHYRSRGVIVPTPYGHCPILLFRPEDSICVIELKFGKPKARAYMPLDGIMRKERAIAQSNLVAMREDEQYVRAFYAAELKIRV